MLDWQLPEAYGSLPPPSSPLNAKASTRCSFQLITNSVICYFIKYLIYVHFKDHKKFFIAYYSQKSKKSHEITKFPIKINLFLVEVSGFEPLTFRVQNGRSANWATPPKQFRLGKFVLPITLPQLCKGDLGGPKSTWTTDLSVISGVLWPPEL